MFVVESELLLHFCMYIVCFELCFIGVSHGYWFLLINLLCSRTFHSFALIANLISELYTAVLIVMLAILTVH